MARLYQNQLEGMYTCRHPGPCKTTNQGRSLGTLEFASPMSLPPLESGLPVSPAVLVGTGILKRPEAQAYSS